MVRGLPAFRTGSAAEDRLHPAVAVGRQIGDNAFDLADEVLVRLRPATDKLPLGVLRPLGEVRAGNADDVRDGLHRELPAVDDSKRDVPLFGPPASSASFRISASRVFLPSKRWSSRTWFCSARYSEAGTTFSSAPAAVSAPWATRRRQVNT